jgi:hypothetical protein
LHCTWENLIKKRENKTQKTSIKIRSGVALHIENYNEKQMKNRRTTIKIRCGE